MAIRDFPPTIFLTSAASSEQLPRDAGAEVAFIGRSNSGKSSAINAITGMKGLARTSKTPGRTQLLNFFEISPCQRLVDLPGYGYAKVNSKKKKAWEPVIEDYLQTRRSLKCLIITMDCRHPLKELDKSMLLWAAHYQINCYILLTKADKLTRQEGLITLRKTQQSLLKLSPNTHAQLFSATKSTGLGNAREIILNCLKESN